MVTNGVFSPASSCLYRTSTSPDNNRTKEEGQGQGTGTRSHRGTTRVPFIHRQRCKEGGRPSPSFVVCPSSVSWQVFSAESQVQFHILVSSWRNSILRHIVPGNGRKMFESLLNGRRTTTTEEECYCWWTRCSIYKSWLFKVSVSTMSSEDETICNWVSVGVPEQVQWLSISECEDCLTDNPRQRVQEVTTSYQFSRSSAGH